MTVSIDRSKLYPPGYVSPPGREEVDALLDEAATVADNLQEEVNAWRQWSEALMKAFEVHGTLGLLMMFAHDGSLPRDVRIRAARLLGWPLRSLGLE